MPNTIPHIMKLVQETPWAIQASKLLAICEFLALRASGIKLTQEQIEANLAPSREAALNRPKASDPGNVAYIQIYGVLANRASILDEISGVVGSDQITARMKQAIANPDIKAIVLDIDSPGGMVAGIPELAALIASSPKYVVAVANQLCASAAYWLASQADEIVVSPSGEVGSIGVVAIHQDLSAAYEAEGIKNTVLTSSPHKYEGNPYQPLTDEAKAHMQSQIDTYGAMFVNAVAKGRSTATGTAITAATVKAQYGGGRTLLAQDAKKAGMVDRVDTLDNVVRSFGGTMVPIKRQQAATVDDWKGDVGAEATAATPAAQAEDAETVAREMAFLRDTHDL